MLKKLNLKKNKISKLAKDEVFKQIPNFSKYYISNYGRCWSTIRNIILKPFKTGTESLNNDYPTYLLVPDNGGKEKKKKAHRLVGEMFVKNPLPLKYDSVHHKDKNRWNSYYKNLEWTNRIEHKIKDMDKEVYYYDFYKDKHKKVKSLEELSNKTDIPLNEVRSLINRYSNFEDLININGIYYKPINVNYNPQTKEFFNIDHGSYLIGYRKII